MSTNELKVNKEILELAKTIKPELKIGDAGVVTLDKKFYETNLPAGLTMEQVEQLQAYDSNLLSATALALGEVSLPHFKKHKNVERTSLEYSAGKNKVELRCLREKHVPAGPLGGEPTTKFGVLEASYRVHAARNVGSFAKIRAHMSEQGKKLLG